MNDIAELVHSSAPEHEYMVLSDILVSRRMVLDLIPEYFTGTRRNLFNALSVQWGDYGEITPELLGDDVAETVSHSLEHTSNSSREIRDSLHSQYLRRSHGLMMLESMKAETPESALRSLQEYIADALFSHSRQNYNHAESVSGLLGVIENAATHYTGYSGYGVGLAEYDRLTNGLERGKVYVIGALKKTGKSRFMAHCALTANRSGAGVLIDTLEMSPMRINMLALAHLSGLDSAKLTQAMRQDEYEKMREGMEALRGLSWAIYSDRTVADLRSRVIYQRTKADVDVVFVDFIQRMRDDNYKRDRVREVERVSQDLADLAREQQVAVVEICQLKGEAEFVDKRNKKESLQWGGTPEDHEETMPDMSHVKESQGIAENADVITILHNPKRHESPYAQDGSYVYPTMMCRVEQRDGVSGTILRFKADLRNCRFTCA